MKPNERVKKIKGELKDFMRLFGMNISASGIPNEECCVVTYKDALFLVEHTEKLRAVLELAIYTMIGSRAALDLTNPREKENYKQMTMGIERCYEALAKIEAMKL